MELPAGARSRDVRYGLKFHRYDMIYLNIAYTLISPIFDTVWYTWTVPIFYMIQNPSLVKSNYFTVGCVWNFQIGGSSKSAIFQCRKLKFDMVLYFGLINCLTVAKIFSCKKWVFKPNLQKTDKTYSVKNFFIEFARKFYPNLIYKQIEYQLFLQILNQQKLCCFPKNISICLNITVV